VLSLEANIFLRLFTDASSTGDVRTYYLFSPVPPLAPSSFRLILILRFSPSSSYTLSLLISSVFPFTPQSSNSSLFPFHSPAHVAVLLFHLPILAFLLLFLHLLIIVLHLTVTVQLYFLFMKLFPLVPSICFWIVLNFCYSSGTCFRTL
jgi:hypothetical protein